MAKTKGTPDDLDWLFDRDIVDEEEYGNFWSEYWSGNQKERDALIQRYVDAAGESGLATTISLGAVYKNDPIAAAQQAQALSETTDITYKVVRRNARGQFSKRGHFYQAVKR
jgi:hypothetical protein